MVNRNFFFLGHDFFSFVSFFENMMTTCPRLPSFLRSLPPEGHILKKGMGGKAAKASEQSFRDLQRIQSFVKDQPKLVVVFGVIFTRSFRGFEF